MRPLSRTVLGVTAAKVILALLWPVRPEEALIWASATQELGLVHGDALTRGLVRLAGDSSFRTLALRLPGLAASTLWLLPLLLVSSRRGLPPSRAGLAWLSLHLLPGLLIAQAGWGRDSLLVLAWLTAWCVLQGSPSPGRALRLGFVAGLGTALHPLTLLLPLGLVRRESDPREVTGPALLGLLLGGALGALLGDGAWLRPTGDAALHLLTFEPGHVLALVLAGAVLVGPIAPLLALRTQPHSPGRVDSRAQLSWIPLGLLAWCSLQGPVDPRLVLGPCAVAVLPALLAPDRPQRLLSWSARLGLLFALLLLGVEWHGRTSMATARHFEERLPGLAGKTLAARPGLPALARLLRERYPNGLPLCDPDLVRGSLLSLGDPRLRPLIGPSRIGPSPAMALTLLDHPQAAAAPLRDWSTIEVDAPLPIPTGGGGVQLLWPGIARDPQPGRTPGAASGGQ